MNHCAKLNILIALYSVIIISGCLTSGRQNPRNMPQNIISSIDIDEVDGNIPAQEFARLCLAENSSVPQLVEFAKSDGWREAEKSDLNDAGLGNLRRTILEIPGGGGRYRETQTILIFNAMDVKLIANMMERFDRRDRLVRTDCTLYADRQDFLPICAAIGILLKRPPDSNQKFARSNSQFIRWNVVVADKQASVRCDGMGVRDKSGEAEKIPDKYSSDQNVFTGTVISMVVDQMDTVTVQSKNFSGN